MDGPLPNLSTLHGLQRPSEGLNQKNHPPSCDICLQSKYFKTNIALSPNVSTTPITAMGCRQCLPLSVVQLKGKHCQKPHCHNGVVDTACNLKQL